MFSCSEYDFWTFHLKWKQFSLLILRFDFLNLTMLCHLKFLNDMILCTKKEYDVILDTHLN